MLKRSFLNQIKGYFKRPLDKKSVRAFSNKELYEQANLHTSDDEMQRKIVIRNFKNIKDESPNIVDIDTDTGNVRQISTDHNEWNLKNFKQQAKTSFNATFMPSGYPNSVTENYLKFCIISNVGAVGMTAMGFLSTQALFIACGTSVGKASMAAAAY